MRLAPLVAKDGPSLFRWINDRELVHFNAAFHPVHAAHHASWMREIVKRKDTAIFAIRVKRGDRLIGVCQLHSISPVHRNAELQIRIGDARSRGRGYGSEAVRLLLDFAFHDLNLHRVFLHVFSTNKAALKTYEATGFSKEGVFRDAAFVNGRYVDVVVMGVVKRG